MFSISTLLCLNKQYSKRAGEKKFFRRTFLSILELNSDLKSRMMATMTLLNLLNNWTYLIIVQYCCVIIDIVVVFRSSRQVWFENEVFRYIWWKLAAQKKSNLKIQNFKKYNFHLKITLGRYNELKASKVKKWKIKTLDNFYLENSLRSSDLFQDLSGPFSWNMSIHLRFNLFNLSIIRMVLELQKFSEL